MIEKRVALESVELRTDGIVLIKYRKMIVEDGVVLRSEPHRAGIEPDVDIDAMLDAVDGHLAQMQWPAAAGDRAVVKNAAALVRTPENAALFRQRREEATRRLGNRSSAATDRTRGVTRA
jgi:hypothetical protein